MKKILFVWMISLACNQLAEAQVSQDSARRASDRQLGMAYLAKSKSQRSAGFVVMGIGIAAAIGGVAGLSNDLFENTTGYELLFLVGVGAPITSFPLFNSAAKNRGRAEVLLRYENMPLSSIVPVNQNMPALGVAFRFK